MSTVRVYRDDGPLAELIGARLGRPVPLGEVPLAVLGVTLMGLVLAAAGRPLPELAVGAAVAGSVVLAAAGAHRPHSGRFAWLVPPLLRLLEYAFLIRLTVLADPDALPLCFALLSALAFHHYDVVYRLRQQGSAPPAWIQAVGGGWEGRLIVGALLAALGALGPGMLVAAVALGAVYVGESTISWTRYSRAERPAIIDEEEAQDE